MLNSPRTHRVALGVVAAGSALALAACGGPDPQADATPEATEVVEEETPEVDTADFNQGPIPDAAPEVTEEDLPAEPDSAAPLGDRIAWEALEQVSVFASVVDPDATSTCPDIAGTEGESATCTVSFLGEEFDYTITVESSGVLISYQQELPEGPLVREAVEDTLRVQAETEYVLCDMEADLVRGEPDTDAPFTCLALDETTGEADEYTLSISMYGAFTFFVV
ncbi:hypothetical protein ACFWTE_10795 [Nocardiopsis sp. NPDC058631]|uniref:hypothetical protein n=1 Tax=Nocardiopsis sp. NPDC058631 TaxID=3346566 RepID=UPI003663132E